VIGPILQRIAQASDSIQGAASGGVLAGNDTLTAASGAVAAVAAAAAVVVSYMGLRFSARSRRIQRDEHYYRVIVADRGIPTVLAFIANMTSRLAVHVKTASGFDDELPVNQLRQLQNTAQSDFEETFFEMRDELVGAARAWSGSAAYTNELISTLENWEEAITDRLLAALNDRGQEANLRQAVRTGGEAVIQLIRTCHPEL
jgi:hypothetical protein